MNIADVREGDRVASTETGRIGDVRCLLPAGYVEVEFAEGPEVVMVSGLELVARIRHHVMASIPARDLLEEGDAAEERERLRTIERACLIRAIESAITTLDGFSALARPEQVQGLLEQVRAYLVGEASDAIESAAAQ